jgi:DNA-binding response OmpR family regulator
MMSDERVRGVEWERGRSSDLPWPRGRVLVIAEQLVRREVIAGALRRSGLDVIEARNGEEALARLRAELGDREGVALDLVLSDADVPGKSGLQLLAWLRERDWTTPFILMAPKQEARGELAAWRLGANRILHRPFNLSELRSAVLEYVPS